MTNSVNNGPANNQFLMEILVKASTDIHSEVRLKVLNTIGNIIYQQ